jgi:putative membrane protein
MKPFQILSISTFIIILAALFNFQRSTKAEISYFLRGDNGLDGDDKSFIMKAYSGGMMEVKLGKAAQIQSENNRVRNFGIMMDHDHTLANDELKSIAENKNISVPDQLDNDHQRHVDKMKEKSGADFDKAYMDMMVDDHKEDIKEFEEASGKATDDQLKKFIDKTLPVLKMHLDSATAILKSLK